MAQASIFFGTSQTLTKPQIKEARFRKSAPLEKLITKARRALLSSVD